MIQQYVPMPDGEMEPNDYGGYVLHSEHAAQIAAKDAEIAELQRRLQRWRATGGEDLPKRASKGRAKNE